MVNHPKRSNRNPFTLLDPVTDQPRDPADVIDDEPHNHMFSAFESDFTILVDTNEYRHPATNEPLGYTTLVCYVRGPAADVMLPTSVRPDGMCISPEDAIAASRVRDAARRDLVRAIPPAAARYYRRLAGGEEVKFLFARAGEREWTIIGSRD